MVAAAVVMESDAVGIGRVVTDIERELGYRLHYADLRSRERRLAAIEALDTIADWDGYIFETARPLPSTNYSEHHVRAKLLDRAFALLSMDVGVTKITLETRASPHKGFTQLDDRDARLLQSMKTDGTVPADLSISHADKSESMIVIADILAGARSDYLCRVDLEAYPLVGHRVRRIDSRFGDQP